MPYISPESVCSPKDLVADIALVEGYRAMADDEDREREAMEWSDALMGDVLATR